MTERVIAAFVIRNPRSRSPVEAALLILEEGRFRLCV
jgi:hypothetical protein